MPSYRERASTLPHKLDCPLPWRVQAAPNGEVPSLIELALSEGGSVTLG